ncbi:hypothetical protein [Steroidobacter sp.]|uniref:hypothetical protein n=1 Tax=Steroidobacter sp. TaxID=1978227 RepID=UPI001A61D621|nr:hypothetical protein [Steroidobacter sp.]MBL8265189.1 hypothetical protein [Steroidobacter sp.]
MDWAAIRGAVTAASIAKTATRYTFLDLRAADGLEIDLTKDNYDRRLGDDDEDSSSRITFVGSEPLPRA